MAPVGYGPTHVLLIALAGVFVAGTVLHAFRASTAEKPAVQWFLSAICALPVLFLLLQAREYSLADPASVGSIRRCETAAAGLFLVIYPWFLALVTRARGRLMPLLIAGAGLVMTARGVTSPTGLWLRTIDEVRIETLPWGETIYHAHGQPSLWIVYTLALWVVLTIYGIACALRYRRRHPDAVGARALALFHAFFFVAMIHDMAVDAVGATSIGLSIFCAPLLVGGMWWRSAVEERRRVAALRDLFGGAADGIVVLDAASGAIREINLAATRILARERSALVGNRLDALVSDEDRPRFSALLERVAREHGREPAMIAVLCRRPSGEEFPAQVMLRFAMLESLPSVVASLRDVSELARAEAERKQLELQMLHAQRLESLGVLAGGIAHDFNNILTAILGRLGLVSSKVESPSARSHLAEAELAVQRAADLCRQMLVYAGKGKPQVRPIDLSRLVDEMGRMLEVSVPRQIELRHDLADGLPPVAGDANQLRQVVMNLITNAAEAIGGQAGRIVLRTRAVDAASLPPERFVSGGPTTGACVAIEVADSGCGMDEATRRRMFDPFFTTKFTGRGLGMSAILGIVRDHGGGLSVESEIGRGTTITVYLPARPEPVPIPAAPEPPARPDQLTVRALLADDDDAVRVLTAGMLEHLGIDSLVTASGAQALAAYAEQERHLQLVLLDVNMPAPDGIAVLRELRSRHPELPIVLMSGRPVTDIPAEVLEQEHTTFLPKPYTLEELSEAIARTQGRVGA
jgi:PAS domain S-box-containing protein